MFIGQFNNFGIPVAALYQAYQQIQPIATAASTEQINVTASGPPKRLTPEERARLEAQAKQGGMVGGVAGIILAQDDQLIKMGYKSGEVLQVSSDGQPLLSPSITKPIESKKEGLKVAGMIGTGLLVAALL